MKAGVKTFKSADRRSTKNTVGKQPRSINRDAQEIKSGLNTEIFG
jgi:hypothetical protein